MKFFVNASQVQNDAHDTALPTARGGRTRSLVHGVPGTRAASAQRGRRHSAGTAASPNPNSLNGSNFRRLVAKGLQGSIQIQLLRVAGGLYVEREDTPRLGFCTSQAIQFDQAADFAQWCDEDPVRFEHPLLYTKLRHDGADLWEMGA